VRKAKNLLAGAVAVSVLLVLGAAPDTLRGPYTACGMTPAAWATTVDFFVSPAGDDRWSGRVIDPGENDGPFATIARAREAVRVWRKTQKESRTVRVVLRGGTYYFDQPLEFGPEDSDIEIARNRITDIGAGGIRIGHFISWASTGELTEGERQLRAAIPSGPHSRRITVADNEIAHCGRFTQGAADCRRGVGARGLDAEHDR